jgi:hypothetical protein
MVFQLGEPINSQGERFEPRIVGQTTLFPLESQLRDSMEELYQRAVERNKTPGEKKISGYIHSWAEDKVDEDFKTISERVLAVFKDTIRPYIAGLKVKEQSGGFHFGPALMGYEKELENVRYRLIFRVSLDSRYLIVSPSLAYKLKDGSKIQPAIQNWDLERSYERILDYLFRNIHVEQGDVRNVEAKSWALEYSLKPILSEELPEAAAEFSKGCDSLENHAETVHQAAALILYTRKGRKAVAELEKRLVGRQGVDEEFRLSAAIEAGKKGVTWRAVKILDQIPFPETPTLDKYFV